MIINIRPSGSMTLLSQIEIEELKKTASSSIYNLYRNCTLAILSTGKHIDNSHELLSNHNDFAVNVLRRERGIKVELTNPPTSAFVDGKIIKSIQEHLFAVLRDIVYVNLQFNYTQTSFTHLDDDNSFHITNLVFNILRNAKAITLGVEPNLVVCWGGHSINPIEYQYGKAVGHELGLRKLNIATGCGPGAMEAPMKGANIGHSKQRYNNGRYLGLTEPSIIAAEPPNPIVNELVIMPDIEKRLESFVRLAHGFIVFPGGPGTAEEILYILGIMMHPDNADQPMPIILTGPKESSKYFQAIDQFICATLGAKAQKFYQIIIDDPQKVARIMSDSMRRVKESRDIKNDSYSFNWSLKIPFEFQLPFEPTHENMAKLNLHLMQSPQELAANLRCAFSGIVAGNVKASGIDAIKQHGEFLIDGDPQLMQHLDKLLQSFIDQDRMKIPNGEPYKACYKILTT